MHLDALAAARRHEHRFDDGNPLAERNTRRAMWLTVSMMLVEIVGGWWFNSMAVLADGWHMSSHALALGLSVFAYRCARRYAHDPRFAFGTWKIEILAGYTSAIALLGVAALMAVQSLERLWVPAPIHYDEAIAIAVVGLAVNLLCAWWLHDSPGHAHHHHGHAHGDHHGHDHAHHDHAHGHDLNLRSAYVHVLADAATSVLAIVALLGGKLLGLTWLDPVMGLVGAVLVTVWAVGLLRDSGRILLDAQMDAPVVAEVREVIEQGPWPARLADLHVWQVGRGKYAVSASVVTSDASLDADTVRNALAIHEELVHVTVEIHRSSSCATAVESVEPSPCSACRCLCNAEPCSAVAGHQPSTGSALQSELQHHPQQVHQQRQRADHCASNADPRPALTAHARGHCQAAAHQRRAQHAHAQTGGHAIAACGRRRLRSQRARAPAHCNAQPTGHAAPRCLALRHPKTPVFLPNFCTGRARLLPTLAAPAL